MASFDDLLNWLGPDAGEQYEAIRRGLIRIFISNGLDDAEDLTDETIDRVVKRLPDLVDRYEGEKARYFYGVARNVIHEARRRKEISTDKLPERISSVADTSLKYDCMVKCLEVIQGEKTDLVLDYYLYEGRDKIKHHQRMAAELGITVGALRTRAHHTRRELQKCIELCEENLAQTQKITRKAFLQSRKEAGDIIEERSHQPGE